MNTRTLRPDDDAAAAQPRGDHLHLVLDAGRPRGGARFSLVGIDTVRIGRGAVLTAERRDATLTITCADPWMSTQHARLEREREHFRVLDAGSRNGVSVNGTLGDHALVLDDDVLELGRTYFVRRAGGRMAPDLVLESPAPDGDELLTLVPELAHRFEELIRVAAATIPVLVGGPTGVGKERVARTVHRASGRRGAFVPVNCGALPTGLVESELFGYKRGAFSGAAVDHVGLIATADGGTLFLDEIGDLPLPAQAALLRVIEAKELRPVGANTAIPIDLRLVAATHRDLEAMVRAGTFRDDLLARLSGFSLVLPGLRERRVDLGLLLGSVLPAGTVITSAAARTLLACTWPRNIRELVRVAERALALAQGAELGPAHLPDELRNQTSVASNAHDPQKAELIALLQKYRGNVTRIAAELGVVRQQVQKRLKRHALDPGRYR